MEHLKECQTGLWLNSVCWLLSLCQECLWCLCGIVFSKLLITGSHRSVCQYLYILLCGLEDFEYVVIDLSLPYRQNYSIYQESFLFAITINGIVTMIHCPILCCSCWWLGHLKCVNVPLNGSLTYPSAGCAYGVRRMDSNSPSFWSTRIMCGHFFWLRGNIFLTWRPMYIYHRILLNSSLNHKCFRQKL